MSRQNVSDFFGSLIDGGEAGLPTDPTAADVVGYAGRKGFEFSESELRSALKEMIFTARSLPAGWGWNLARDLGLVHKS